MNEHKKLIASAICLSIIVMGMAILDFVRDTKSASASAPGGLFATVATSTKYTVSTATGGTVVFATSTCAARIITTVEKPIMITFTNAQGDTATAIHGHYQAASTTVAYDGAIFGCQAWKIYGHDAPSTLTLTETR